MKKTEMSEFSKLLMGIGALYGKSMTPALIEIYWQSLQAFGFSQVKAAIHAHVNNPDTGQFLPQPADVIRYLQGSSESRGLQAWSRVLRAIQQVGCYSSVIFDDPLIHAVIDDMGGWIQLGKLQEKDIPFRAQEFVKRYMGFVLNPPKSYPKQLTGLVEHQNNCMGYPSDPPLLLGDKQKALQVYEQGTIHRQLVSTHDFEKLMPITPLTNNQST
jgi:hypothetical protein